ncbi:MAG: hypothetical protein FJ299_11955 [Planctomycetes bacterium]|nr:hypothetical protein [Planctomycetota bacterium]
MATRRYVVELSPPESVERVSRRAVIETRDARAWHAILRALGNHKVPQDYGLPPQPDKQARLRARGLDQLAGGSESGS